MKTWNLIFRSANHQRAAGSCVYCGISEAATFFAHQIDHVIAEQLRDRRDKLWRAAHLTRIQQLRGFCAIILFSSLCAVAQEQPAGSSTQQTVSGHSSNHDYWAVEDARERAKMPLYKIVPAARLEELTPANGYPKPETFLTWHRSHGDNGGMRYSALKQINRQNVAKLRRA